MNKFLELFEREINFYALQYYGIDFISPMHFLGYVFILEGIAVRHGSRVEDRVTKVHGKPASSFLRVHSNEDPEHLEQAIGILKSLNEVDLEIASKSLVHSSRGYSAILGAIRTRISG